MTTKKHDDFVKEPIRDKPVTALPGIREQLGETLNRNGIHQASTVLGHFLVIEMDKEKFKDWLSEKCGGKAQPEDLQACYDCLKEWCDKHLSMATEAHRKFVSESMKGKPVTDLAGIGEHLGQVLTRRGFDQASMVLGHFLVMGMNEEKFKEWLMENCGAQRHQQQACYACIRDWCKEHL